LIVGQAPRNFSAMTDDAISGRRNDERHTHGWTAFLSGRENGAFRRGSRFRVAFDSDRDRRADPRMGVVAFESEVFEPKVVE
jgi:hypothetical protein